MQIEVAALAMLAIVAMKVTALAQGGHSTHTRSSTPKCPGTCKHVERVGAVTHTECGYEFCPASYKKDNTHCDCQP